MATEKISGAEALIKSLIAEKTEYIFGYPGGAIMAALGPLQSMLGFDETLQGLMIALYIAMDSFGTAGNVTGDGAIALIVDRIYRRRKTPGTEPAGRTDSDA